MDDRAALIETYRAEAIALLAINQRARLTAQRIGWAIFVTIFATTVVGIVARTDDVAIPLPPLVLVLLSAMFQQYADVTVIGAARATLERRLEEELGGGALIYETDVAPIRKRPPLVFSVRFLQGLGAALVALAIVAGAVVAFDHQPAAVQIGFTVLTATSVVSAALSYRDMLRSGPVAAAELEAARLRRRS